VYTSVVDCFVQKFVSNMYSPCFLVRNVWLLLHFIVEAFTPVPISTQLHTLLIAVSVSYIRLIGKDSVTLR
jgi:hypothetical protein